MTQHTPGPWVLHEGKTAVNGADGHLVASCGSLPYRNKWDEEANARLIAAAPELLEALILAEVQFDSFYTATMTNAKSRDENRALKKLALEGIRSVIAKARGKVSQ